MTLLFESFSLMLGLMECTQILEKKLYILYSRIQIYCNYKNHFKLSTNFSKFLIKARRAILAYAKVV